MCGINGFVSLKNQPVSQTDIEKMNQAINYRGPDDRGIFIDRNVGLGHLRLAILDLSQSGHQPMIYTHQGRTAVITFNGEVYNFFEIRSELEQKGYVFDSQTDTEVLAAAYLEYGTECLSKFNGMFAFVIYDKEESILFGARDRFGKKPLKYYFDGDRFIFSSELKAILTHAIPRQVDGKAIYDFLTLQYVPAPRTGFVHIQKLEQGHYFTLSLKDGRFTKQKYFSLNYIPRYDRSQSEWETYVLEEIDRAVSLRMISDVPIGVFLSGGIDSSAVVASMSQFTDKVKTFSIRFGEKEFDEGVYAQQVSALYQTEHHECRVGPQDLLAHIENLFVHYEEPYADSSQLPTYMLSQYTRKYVTVALSGDGGDENFAGYDKYRVHLALLRYPWLAEALKIFPSRFLSSKINLIKRMGSLSPARRHYNLTNYFDEWLKSRWCMPGYNSSHQGVENIFENKVKEIHAEWINQILWLDFHSYVPDDLNVKTDMASMAHALEVRAPFLDHLFVLRMAEMPSRLKLDFFQGKKILRRALRSRLPRSVLTRQKHGFSVPIDAWFQHELRPYIREQFHDQESFIYTLFRREAIQHMLEEHQSKCGHGKRLWALLALEMWHKAYFS